MTKEDAIDIIKSECYVFNPLNFDRSTMVNTALDMAVKALEQEPCEDAVSRQAVLDCQHFIYDETGEELEVIHAESVLNLPSVTPHQKTGRWINIDETHSKCDRCGAVFEIASGNGDVNYCPNCGQPKMQEVEE